MAGANFSSFYQLFNLKQSIDDVTKSWLPRAITISEININTTDLRQSQLQLIFADSEIEREAQADRIVELIDSISANLDEYEQLRGTRVDAGLVLRKRSEGSMNRLI